MNGQRAHLAEKRDARACVEPRIQPQDTIAAAVIDGRVPKHAPASDTNELYARLNAIAGSLALEELELSRPPLAHRLHRGSFDARTRWIVDCATRSRWTPTAIALSASSSGSTPTARARIEHRQTEEGGSIPPPPRCWHLASATRSHG
ncbi:MAG TPA: hypothetical protein VFD92_13855 [Candidatus Binatia bacterium]|nr:hypothetical protein [Candidatus Binatia bacterium]